MHSILLAEDDYNLGDLLLDFLEVKGYDVVWTKNGKEAYEMFDNKNFDVCIFDVMMPELDGFSLAKKIRETNSTIPIIFLTARSLETDKLTGFEVGADDYMTKPFSMEELLARINAKLKRNINSESIENNHHYRIGLYNFDFKIQELAYQLEEAIKLTSKENDLLHLLVQNINNVTDRK